MKSIQSLPILACFISTYMLLAETADVDLQIEHAVQVSFLAKAGSVYNVESSPEADPQAWSVEGNPIEGVGQRYVNFFASTETPQRIFRINELIGSTGLVGFYPFNGDSNDLSGRGNNGTANSAVFAANRFDEPSKAVSFSEVGQYIRTEAATGFPQEIQDFTVSLWVSLASLPPESDPHQVLFANEGINQFQLGLSPMTNGKSQIRFYIGGGAMVDLESAELDWVFGQWYNIQVLRSANTLQLFRDGLLVAESQTGEVISASNLSFGYRTSNNNHQFYGRLDDIRIYNLPLSLNELSILRNIGG